MTFMMTKRLLRAYLRRKAAEQQEIIDSVRVLGKRYVAAVDELEEIEELLTLVDADDQKGTARQPPRRTTWEAA